MSDKRIIMLDATSLSSSACMQKFWNICIEGYKQLPDASAIYGVAFHGFVDAMYRTKGNLRVASDKAKKLFNEPKIENTKYKYVNDYNHLIGVCYNAWNDWLQQDNNYQLLTIPSKCWCCDGTGITPGEHSCTICCGHGIIPGPSSELTFKIRFYEDKHIIVYLCGTIDNIGKFVNGIFALRDFKTTSQHDQEEFLSGFELKAQLRVYTLAFKLMAEQEPESTLGKIGAGKIGAFIDGIFLSSKINDVTFARSQVFVFDDNDMAHFRYMLGCFCQKLSSAIQQYQPISKDGIMNGVCTQFFKKCQFWNVCRNNKVVGDLILKRDFIRKEYNPLMWHE